MQWMIFAGCVVGIWVVLSILGQERHRRLLDIERQAKTHSDDAAPPSQPAASAAANGVNPH